MEVWQLTARPPNTHSQRGFSLSPKDTIAAFPLKLAVAINMLAANIWHLAPFQLGVTPAGQPRSLHLRCCVSADVGGQHGSQCGSGGGGGQCAVWLGLRLEELGNFTVLPELQYSE